MNDLHQRSGRARLLCLGGLLGALALGGCASAAARPPGGVGAAAGVPGFDTRVYPGDGVMRQWREASPYRWVGYYLPAPCHPRSTWQGKRAALEDIGWGFAVLFVGEQDWTAVADPPEGPGDTPPGEAPRCTAANLSAARGAQDARTAVAAAAADGFPPATTIYLNVERVEVVSPQLAAYVRAWVGGLLDDGAMRPGLYVHARNAEALRAEAAAAYAERRHAGGPRLWVAKSGGFDLRAAPAASGVDGANVWQGLFGVRETWGGATLTIDANVADTASPST